MLFLSVTIAVMGLSLDSAAVVIGAMLIAPLMTPVMQFSAALILGLPRRMLRAASIVLLASAGSVAYAWILTALLPHQPLTQEVLSRTSPDFRDLCVALAAGAAGAYALAREDVSAALPGVAVAVALVPPLAAVGMALEAGRRDLAEGAALLYVANLVAIALTGAVVFLASGMVPKRRLVDISPRVAAGFLGVVAAAIVIGVPLAARSVAVADRFQESETVTQQVDSWLGPNLALDVQSVKVDDHVVTVDLAGSTVPPDTTPLIAGISAALGRAVKVDVRWQQRSDLSVAATGDLGVTQTRLKAIVKSWLEAASQGAVTDAVVSVTPTKTDLTVELTGPQTPPPANSLAKTLDEQLGVKRRVKISWTQQVVTQSGAKPGDAELLAGAKAAAEAWARNGNNIDVVDVTYSGGMVTIDLAGATAPSSTRPIVRAVHDATRASVDVQVRFVRRQVLH